MKFINFIFFMLLLTLSISRADMVGLLLSLTGFLIMHSIIEQSIENHG